MSNNFSILLKQFISTFIKTYPDYKIMHVSKLDHDELEDWVQIKYYRIYNGDNMELKNKIICNVYDSKLNK